MDADLYPQHSAVSMQTFMCSSGNAISDHHSHVFVCPCTHICTYIRIQCIVCRMPVGVS